MDKTINHFHELGYTVIAEPHETYVDFVVYEIIGETLDGTPVYWLDGWNSSADVVEELEKAQIYLTGSVKWDGCSDWQFKEDDLGFSGKQEAMKKLSGLWEAMYEMAEEMLGTEL